MSVTLPYLPITWALHRILITPTWAGGKATWQVLPMVQPGLKSSNGFEVLRYSRVTLPAVGEAVLRFRYGRINGSMVAAAGATAAALSAGGTWSAGTSAITYPDLRRQEIRIQAAPRVTTGTPAWRTVWWGQCEYQEQRDMPGASVPSGDIIYHCTDGFYRTKHWIMNHHGAYLVSPQGVALKYVSGFGHPGYNGVDGMGTVSGNNAQLNYDPTATSYGDNDTTGQGGDGLNNIPYLCWPGGGYPFSDLDVANHALGVVRPYNEPPFKLVGASAQATSTFSLVSGCAWPVGEDESVWDFINRLCDRRRARGLTYVDWSDDTANPTGPLVVKLTTAPQLAADVVVNVPATQSGFGITSPATTSTMFGATTCNTAIAVDLIGDHRLDEATFQLGDREQHRVDALETCGEQIQVLTTLSMYDASMGIASLEARWTAALAAAFAALNPVNRLAEYWRSVYQLYGLPRAWQGLAADHNGGKTVAAGRVDYRCDDTGTIITDEAPNDTAPMLVEVMPDLPLLDGYDYAKYPAVRLDGQTESGMPPRRPPFALVRYTPGRFINGDGVGPLTIRVAKDGIFLGCPSDNNVQQGASRTISDPTVNGLGAQYATSVLGCTVGLRLPHRIRYRTVAFNSPAGPVAPTQTLAAAIAANQALQASAAAAVQQAQANFTTSLTAGSAAGIVYSLQQLNDAQAAQAAVPPPPSAVTVRRTRTITHRNLHLWLAAPSAVWDLDTSPASYDGTGYLGKYSACGGSGDQPGLLRDDRAALNALHQLACQWYLSARRTVRWSLRDCGFLPYYTSTSAVNVGDGATATGPIPYPLLGQLVTQLYAAGQATTINTPITAIHYDNESGVTTWSTDWSELDFK